MHEQEKINRPKKTKTNAKNKINAAAKSKQTKLQWSQVASKKPTKKPAEDAAKEPEAVTPDKTKTKTLAK